MAGTQGFEPRYADPESAVLPLDDVPPRVALRIAAAAFGDALYKTSAKLLFYNFFARIA